MATELGTFCPLLNSKHRCQLHNSEQNNNIDSKLNADSSLTHVAPICRCLPPFRSCCVLSTGISNKLPLQVWYRQWAWILWILSFLMLLGGSTGSVGLWFFWVATSKGPSSDYSGTGHAARSQHDTTDIDGDLSGDESVSAEDLQGEQAADMHKLQCLLFLSSCRQHMASIKKAEQAHAAC